MKAILVNLKKKMFLFGEKVYDYIHRIFEVSFINLSFLVGITIGHKNINAFRGKVYQGVLGNNRKHKRIRDFTFTELFKVNIVILLAFFFHNEAKASKTLGVSTIPKKSGSKPRILSQGKEITENIGGSVEKKRTDIYYSPQEGLSVLSNRRATA